MGFFCVRVAQNQTSSVRGRDHPAKLMNPMRSLPKQFFQFAVREWQQLRGFSVDLNSRLRLTQHNGAAEDEQCEVEDSTTAHSSMRMPRPQRDQQLNEI